MRRASSLQALLALLLAAPAAGAAQLRYGTVSWRIPDPEAAPLSVEFTVATGWQSTSINGNGTSLDFGDGAASGVMLGVPAGGGVDADGDVYTVTQFKVVHTYAAPGKYMAAFHDCCREPGLENGAGGPYRVGALVSLEGGRAGGPVSGSPAVIELEAGGVRSFTFPVFDPDRGALECRFGTGEESGLPVMAAVPMVAADGAAPALAMTTEGCQLTWDLTHATPGDRYALHVIFASTRASVTATSSLDVVGQIVAAPLPVCEGGGQHILSVGQPFATDLTGASLPGETLLMTSIGAPLGSSFAPACGASGTSPISTTFSWIPGPSDAGSVHIVAVDFTDSRSETGTCSLSIFVPPCEGYGLPCTAGLGLCATAGTGTCAGPKVSCDAVPSEPTPEICNGLDDDCDGAIDDGFGVGAGCLAGVGACASSGVVVCDGDGAALCAATPGAPQPETCNGLDDDCDGLIDEGFDIGASCTTGVGACASSGVIVCDGPLHGRCDAVPGAPATEVCWNAADEDCDGRLDNGCTCTSDEDCREGLHCSTNGVCEAPEAFLPSGSGLSACSCREAPAPYPPSDGALIGLVLAAAGLLRGRREPGGRPASSRGGRGRGGVFAS